MRFAARIHSQCYGCKSLLYLTILIQHQGLKMAIYSSNQTYVVVEHVENWKIMFICSVEEGL